MNKVNSLIIIFSVFFFQIKAENKVDLSQKKAENLSLFSKKIKGEIFTKNDTIKTILKIPIKPILNTIDYESLDRKIYYINESGKKKSFKLNEILGIKFKYKGENITLFSKRNTFHKQKNSSKVNYVFCKLIVDGKLKILEAMIFDKIQQAINRARGFNNINDSKQKLLVIQKDNDEIISPNSFYRKKQFIKYFNDCPELVSRIEDKELNVYDLFSFVEFYNNSNCK